MIFSNVKSITIPEGVVKKIEAGNKVLWSGGGLPSAYQQVEYIAAAAGVQAYFDLKIAFDTAAKVRMTYYHAGQNQIFGAAENSGKLRCMISCTPTNVSFYGSNGSAYIDTSVAATQNAYNTVELTLKAGSLLSADLTSGNSKELKTQAAYTMTSNLYLFAQMYNGSARINGVRQITEFKYWDKNDELICDLVPCYRKSDSVIGMYDLVRNIFFTSEGTGAFTKGANV